MRHFRVPHVFSDPHHVRSFGVAAEFEDRLMKDGQTYKRVAPGHFPELEQALQQHFDKPLKFEAQGWRLNYAGELPNRAIHSDGGWGEYAAVVCMDPNVPEGNGTMLWRHKASGLESVTPEDLAGYFAMMSDWDDVSKFEQVHFNQARFNEAFVYHSSLLHSRWPFEAYGDSPQNGRLTIVAFFSEDPNG